MNTPPAAEPPAFEYALLAVVDFLSMQPWENWYRSTAHTFGSWLPGDPRGWRSRHRREHCEGDYKHPPPPEKYAELWARSKELMKRDPVRLQQSIREFVLQMFVEGMMSRGHDVQIGSLDGIHLHVLHQCWKRNSRVELGIAKQYATAQLKAQSSALGLHLNLNPGEGLWSAGSHPEPIATRSHFYRTIGYIRDHAKQGAIIWEPADCFNQIPQLDLTV